MQLPEVQDEYPQLEECKVPVILDEHTGGKWRVYSGFPQLVHRNVHKNGLYPEMSLHCLMMIKHHMTGQIVD